jgi:dUTP pyrophosphatase
MTDLTIEVVVLPHGQGLPLPRYMTAGSAGMDVQAAVDQPVTMRPGETALIPTGLVLGLPQGLEAQVRPRSGLAFKQGVTVLNSPGTIDSDYRGEVRILLINHGQEDVIIERGQRIAQLVFHRWERVELSPAGQIDPTGRGEGGFGHTGK